MFCPKCGTKAIDGAEFCQKCGTRLIIDTSMEQPTVSQAAQIHQPPPSQTTSTSKKKSKLPIIIGAIVAVVVLVIAFVALNWEGKKDYVATVRAYEPFTNSEGLPYTCGEVFDKYIPNAEWNVRKANDEVFVDISGTAEGADSELVVTIQVEVTEDHAIMKPISTELDGEELTENAFFAFFVAYDEKDDNLSHLDALIGEVDFALRGGQLAGAFTDEESGISFSYPDWWVTTDSPSEYEIVKMISPRNSGNHTTTLRVTKSLDSDPYGVFSGNEESVKDSVNEYHTFLDYGDVMLGDISAKALRYQTAGLSSDDIVIAFCYNVGGEVYWVECSYTASTEAIYAPIIQAIVNSYTVDYKSVSISGPAYQGVSLLSVLGCAPVQLYDTFGSPTSGTPVNGDMYAGGEYYGYDGGMMFFIDWQSPTINAIQGFTEAIDVNGISLDKSRSELIAILGTPANEEYVTDEMIRGTYYIMEYDFDGVTLILNMVDEYSAADSFIMA